MKRTMPIVLLFAVICSIPNAYAQKPRFIVGYLASADFMPALIADQSGFFTQEGLDVALVAFRNGVQLMQTVVSGEAQIGMGSAPELLQAVNAGAKVSAVWGVSNLMPYAFISRPQIRTVAELKGKKVAVSSPGSLSDFLTRYVLKAKALD